MEEKKTKMKKFRCRNPKCNKKILFEYDVNIEKGSIVIVIKCRKCGSFNNVIFTVNPIKKAILVTS